MLLLLQVGVQIVVSVARGALSNRRLGRRLLLSVKEVIELSAGVRWHLVFIVLINLVKRILIRLHIFLSLQERFKAFVCGVSLE